MSAAAVVGEAEAGTGRGSSATRSRVSAATAVGFHATTGKTS
jgi:hypothetical protein